VVKRVGDVCQKCVRVTTGCVGDVLPPGEYRKAIGVRVSRRVIRASHVGTSSVSTRIFLREDLPSLIVDIGCDRIGTGSCACKTLLRQRCKIAPRVEAGSVAGVIVTGRSDSGDSRLVIGVVCFGNSVSSASYMISSKGRSRIVGAENVELLANEA